MRKQDLSPERQKLLVPLTSHPGAFGLVPPSTPLHLSLPRLRGEITRAHEALGRLQASAALWNRSLVMPVLDRWEAVRSSQIEGTRSNMRDLYTFEATGSDAGLPGDVLVTLNYVKALQFGLQEVAQKGAEVLTTRFIQDLHALLMKGMTGYSDVPGSLRTGQNWVAGLRVYDAKFVPPPPDRVSECLEDLVHMLRCTPREEEFSETPLVMRVAIAHAQFETIHPFLDGNGRVGRILIPLIFVATGYSLVYMAGFLKANKDNYYQALRDVQLRGEWTDWVRLFATGVEIACRESIDTATELMATLARWKEALAGMNLRSDAAVHRLLEFLLGTPVVTVNQVMHGMDVSFPAADRALIQLQRIGIVELVKDQKRNRVFVAREIIELLNRATPQGCSLE